MKTTLRTHTCGELRTTDGGATVALVGWVNAQRDHGGLIFIDLVDRYGRTQLVFNPEKSADAHSIAETLRNQFVVRAEGTVSRRPDEMVNPKIPTGEIEVDVKKIEVLNESLTPPFEIEDDSDVAEDLRLRYRYLDLRRPSMRNNLIVRHRVVREIRAALDAEQFIEVETPFLTKSTPEGARDFLVPSRVNPGRFYALPQSPQLFKQILMVAGFDRYYQIARCMRDEDLRADRQPEFTQLDLEMSFVTEDDVMGITERVMARVMKAILDIDIELPITRLTYAEAMDSYGSDKPDLRFELKLRDITDIAREVEFKVFSAVATGGGQVRGINVPGGSQFTRKELDELTAFVSAFGAKGLAWIKVDADAFGGPIAKYISPGAQQKIRETFGAEAGDLLLFVADNPKVVAKSLGALRVHLGRRLKLIPESEFCFCWVTDFPLLEYDEQEKRHVAMHHPFTSPRPEDIDLLATDPANVQARAYDIVLNGVELGGGSIRIHRADVQYQMFRLLGIDKEEAERRFGFLLEALRYGAPPHGGIALGLDRMVRILLGLPSIRDTIAFPKTQKAQCLMTDAPSVIDERQMRELHIQLRPQARRPGQSDTDNKR
ncbi:MAG: aspartate--tRNA ligase [Planctomycetia bacterium]|nr:aspartate--tRNA ligase [Planctomycetia bacterium]